MRICIVAALCLSAAVAPPAFGADDSVRQCEGHAGVALTRQVRACSAVIAAKPGEAQRLIMAYANRGWAYTLLGDSDRAVADFDKAIALDPALESAHRGKGIAHHRKGLYRDAIAAFDRAIAAKPDYAGAFVDRGLAHAALGESERALADLDAAVGILPDVGRYNFLRASVTERLGKAETALADLDRAVSLEPKTAVFHIARGRVRAKLGRTKEAIADFTAALALNPALTSAKRWLDELERRKPATQSPARPPAQIAKDETLALRWPACGEAKAYRGPASRNRPVPSLALRVRALSAVFASSAGRIVSVEPGDGGVTIELQGPRAMATLYGPLGVAFVQPGDIVQAGQIIGRARALETGKPALHFAVLKDGTPQNPRTLLPPASTCEGAASPKTGHGALR